MLLHLLQAAPAPGPGSTLNDILRGGLGVGGTGFGFYWIVRGIKELLALKAGNGHVHARSSDSYLKEREQMAIGIRTEELGKAVATLVDNTAKTNRLLGDIASSMTASSAVVRNDIAEHETLAAERAAAHEDKAATRHTHTIESLFSAVRLAAEGRA